MFLIKIKKKWARRPPRGLINIWLFANQNFGGREQYMYIKKNSYICFKTRPKGVDRTRTWVAPLKAPRPNHLG